MKIITKNTLEKRIKNKYQEQPFEICFYENMTSPFKILCKNCGIQKTYSSPSNFLYSSRKYLCSCYNSKNKNTIHASNERIIKKIIKDQNDHFKKIIYDINLKKYVCFVECHKCNQIFHKTFQSMLTNSTCYYCTNKQKLNEEGFKASLSEEYSLIGEYKNYEDKIKIKHNKCGFIWNTTPHKMANYIGCPLCNKKRSKGEQKIARWLSNNNYYYETEKSFEWQSNKKRRYDFYIPSYNLIIEFMGQQHYSQSTFLKDSVLEEQQKIDKIKKEECLKIGYLYKEISYKDYNNIDSILSSIFFNDQMM